MAAIKVVLSNEGNPTHDQLRHVWLVSSGYQENPDKPQISPHMLPVAPGEAPIVSVKGTRMIVSERLKKDGLEYQMSSDVMVAGKKTEGLVVRL